MAKLVLAALALALLALAGCSSSTPSADAMTPTTAQQSTLHAQLHGFFDDTPYLGAGSSMMAVPGGTPAHEWHVLPDGRLEYLHWDAADPTMAEKLLFVGDTLPGPSMGCLGAGGVTQAQLDAAFEKLRAQRDEFRDELAQELADRLNLDVAKVKEALEATPRFGGRRGP